MNQQVAYERKSGIAKRAEQDEKELEELLKDNAQPEPEPEPEKEATKKEEAPETKEAPKEEELSAEEKSFKKRYGDLRKHFDETKRDYEARIKALENKSETSAPPKSEEEVQQWVKKYPDVAAVVEKIAQQKAEQMVDGFRKKFEEYDQVQEETVRQRAENAIREKHSDFDKLKSSDVFHNWADKQPKWVQDALYENQDDADSVVRVIDLYKMDNNLTPLARKEKTKEAASEVKSRSPVNVDPDEGSKKIRESDVAKMSDTEYEKNEETILEAMRTGNFVYNLSGGAR